MSWASDDLAQVMVNPQSEFVGLAEGIIRSWNPGTFENVINVAGGDIPNVAVASGVEALTYEPGQVVIVSRWRPRSGRGSGTYRIGLSGRVIKPGTGAAQRAIEFMTTSLGSAVSGAVFADRIFTDEIATQEVTASSTYTDLDTVGPSRSGIEIISGRALVFVSGRIRTERSGNGDSETFMSVEVSGPTPVPPSDDRAASLRVRLSNHTGTGVSHITDIAARGTAQIPLSGLAPGTYSFTCKYRTTGAGSNFAARALTVIAF